MSAPTAEDVIAQAIWFQDQPERNTRLILEALAAAGYAVVPVEPTEAMLQTFHDTILIECRPDVQEASVLNDIDAWGAMIAAARERTAVAGEDV